MSTLYRDAPSGHAPLPTLTRADWDQRARWWRNVPRHCTACGGRLVNESPQFERYGRVVCGLGCSREYGWIKNVGRSL